MPENNNEQCRRRKSLRRMGQLLKCWQERLVDIWYHPYKTAEKVAKVGRLTAHMKERKKCVPVTCRQDNDWQRSDRAACKNSSAATPNDRPKVRASGGKRRRLQVTPM
jgi:hypothetical protein